MDVRSVNPVEGLGAGLDLRYSNVSVRAAVCSIGTTTVVVTLTLALCFVTIVRVVGTTNEPRNAGVLSLGAYEP